MKLNRLLRAAAITAAAAIVSVPAAHAAVTNPADNPHRIVVKGDDGNTYVDGQDTLPGFDDEECTYIPGAYYDFANNLVHYADGQSIPWTEWARATGYKEWLASSAIATPSASAAATVAKSVGSAKTKPATSDTNAPQVTPHATAIEASSGATDLVAATPTSVPAPEPSVAVAPAGNTNVAVAPTADPNLGSEAGFAILGALAALAAFTTGGHEARRRLLRKGRP